MPSAPIKSTASTRQAVRRNDELEAGSCKFVVLDLHGFRGSTTGSKRICRGTLAVTGPPPKTVMSNSAATAAPVHRFVRRDRSSCLFARPGIVFHPRAIARLFGLGSTFLLQPFLNRLVCFFRLFLLDPMTAVQADHVDVGYEVNKAF